MIGAGGAQAAVRVAVGATDPSFAPGFLVWERPGGPSFLRHAGRTETLPGEDAAVGGPYLAWHSGAEVTVIRLADRRPILTRTVPGIGDLAVSGRWLAYRRLRSSGGAVIAALRLPAPLREHRVAASRSRSALGRPDLDGDRLAYNVAGSHGSSIRVLNLRRRTGRTLVHVREAQVVNPSLLGRAMAYVKISRCGQELVLSRHGRSRVLFRGRALAGQDRGYDPGHTGQGSRRPCARPGRTSRMLWTTALSPRAAYVAVVRPAVGSAGSTLLRIPR